MSRPAGRQKNWRWLHRAARHRLRRGTSSYEGLVKKFAGARDFHDAFQLRERRDGKVRSLVPKRKISADGFELREFAWDLMTMGKDHQFPVQAIVNR